MFYIIIITYNYSCVNKKRAEYYNVITYVWNLIEKDRKEKVDALAATIILQRYLDQRKD